MSYTREIQNKITSIQNIRKITRAMKLIATNKMLKSQHCMESARLYTDYARNIITNVLQVTTKYHHAYFQNHNITSVGIVVISTDRGLCGGLNINLFKKVLKEIKAFQSNKVKIDLYLVGLKAEKFFKGISGVNIVSMINLHHSGQIYNLVTRVVNIMIEAFCHRNIDLLKVFSNKFVNTIKNIPLGIQLLPILTPQIPANSVITKNWDYIYEPGMLGVLNLLLKRYIESQVYLAVMENIACEQVSRMLAMKNATDNADNMLNKLNLEYNKVRQDFITKELAEIVSGTTKV